MLKIGVLSDTHIQDFGRGVAFLQELVERYLAETSVIFHAGDITNPDLLQAFGERTVYAVAGNMDGSASGLPFRRLVTLGGYRFGLAHGWGAPEGLERRLLREFADDAIDCLVYGHSHQPRCERRNGILLFNPGSPTDRRWAPFHSVGLLELGNSLRGRIIRID